MKQTRTKIPVLLGSNYQHVMGRATITEDDSGTIAITMEADGSEAKELAALLTAGEPMAISFVSIPVQPRQNHIKE